MKFLLKGNNTFLGDEIISQCTADPSIIFTSLPLRNVSDIEETHSWGLQHQKLVEIFTEVEGLIWVLPHDAGESSNSVMLDSASVFDTFLREIAPILEKRPTKGFRVVLCAGWECDRNVPHSLFIKEDADELKKQVMSPLSATLSQHRGVFELSVVRPLGIIPRGSSQFFNIAARIPDISVQEVAGLAIERAKNGVPGKKVQGGEESMSKAEEKKLLVER
ncbi:MAG: hypothetical protein M1834_002583 [Cirrosporium novae-zelandiae]|nr:MAG: hypothetical protein M1834_002583 [Cirrosporium novae-zelandiae]